MSRVFISDALRVILIDAGRRAMARRDQIHVDDLLAALLKGPLGMRMASALHPADTWPLIEASPHIETQTPSIQFDDVLVTLDRAADQLFTLGANRVLLGEYEPRHLAQAVGELASAHRAPFARFGLDPRAWQSALSMIP